MGWYASQYGWYGQQSWGKPKGWYAKGQNKKSWGTWQCSCGSCQGGTYCKGCGAKWWQVQWQKPGPQATEQPKKTWKNQKTDNHSPSNEEVKGFLEQLLQAKGNPLDLPDLRAKAEELKGGFTGPEAKASRTTRLKSVIDKLGHKKSLLKSLKSKLASLVTQVEQLKEQVDNLNVDVISLETERAKLCDSVAKDPESDTESAWEDADGKEQEEQTSTDWWATEDYDTSYQYNQQWKPKFTRDSEGHDDSLEETLDEAFRNWKKRKMAEQSNTNSEDESMPNTQESNVSSG